MSAVQVVAVGLTFVVLYRYVLTALGEHAFGVWAVVLATTSVGHVANFGMAAGTVKFVAKYQARNERSFVGLLIQTAVLTVAGGVGAVVVILFPLLHQLLRFVIEPAAYLADARGILPYALVSFWLTTTSGVLHSCIDGLHRMYIRNLLIVLVSGAYLIFAFLLVPRYGLVGLALAQLMQAGLLVVASWFVLLRLLPSLPIFPFEWKFAAFREMLGYSMRFQAISITQVMFEPMAKALVSMFGGVASVSSFEFAHRMVFQLRALATTAQQSVVPAVSHLHERNPDAIRTIYTRSFRLLLFVVSISLPLLVLLTPDISRLWIGSYDASFVMYATILFVGWFLNMIANPAYFANMGTGSLQWNLYGHLIMVGIFLLFSFPLGLVMSADGVVSAYVVALLVGSFAIVAEYQRRHAIALQEVIDSQTLLLMGTTVLALVLLTVILPHIAAGFSPLVRMVLIALSYLLIILGPVTRHSMNREFVGWIRRAFAPV